MSRRTASFAGLPTVEWRKRFFAADFGGNAPSLTPTDWQGVIRPLPHELQDGAPAPSFVLRAYGTDYGQRPAALRELLDARPPTAMWMVLRRQVAMYLAKRVSRRAWPVIALTFDVSEDVVRDACARVATLTRIDRRIRDRLAEHERLLLAICAQEAEAKTFHDVTRELDPAAMAETQGD